MAAGQTKRYRQLCRRIAVDNTDTLYFDLGMYSNSLTEHNIEVITRQMMEESATDSSDYIIVKDSRYWI